MCVGLLLIAYFLLLAGTPHVAFGYDFKVYNNTADRITHLLVSEDGHQWGRFDIGGGIAPGDSAMLVWDASTDDQDCEQYIVAVFEDLSESEPVVFDFCEDDLELEF
jgi:hypothetical protein